jgi:hypothetical protein
MNIDKTTFGKTPAALYLADYLSKLDKPIVAKRTGKMLTSYRNTLAQLEQANKMAILNAHNLARVVGSMREKFQVNVGDEMASNLVTNIIVGEMKTLLRRSAEIRRIELQQDKYIGSEKIGEIFNKKGYKIAKLTEDTVYFPIYTVNDIPEDINAETLTAKWKIKMKRRNIEV